MKIISKYKDYYDYLQGIYGVDEKLILDRTVESPRSFDPQDYTIVYSKQYVRGKGTIDVPKDVSPNYRVIRFCIGDYSIEGMILGNKVLYGEDLASLAIKEEDLYRYRDYSGVRSTDEYYYIDNPETNGRVSVAKEIRMYTPDKSPCVKESHPILLNAGNNQWHKSPRLDTYGLNKVLAPHQIWVLLSDWLGQRLNVPVPDNMTNKEKIQAAGFDLKTSFRKM